MQSCLLTQTTVYHKGIIFTCLYLYLLGQVFLLYLFQLKLMKVSTISRQFFKKSNDCADLFMEFKCRSIFFPLDLTIALLLCKKVGFCVWRRIIFIDLGIITTTSNFLNARVLAIASAGIVYMHVVL